MKQENNPLIDQNTIFANLISNNPDFNEGGFIERCSLWKEAEETGRKLGLKPGSEEAAQLTAYIMTDGREGASPENFAMRVHLIKTSDQPEFNYIVLHRHRQGLSKNILNSYRQLNAYEDQDEIAEVCELDFEPHLGETIELLLVEDLDSYTLN